jgi:hypothetical protein
MKNMSKWVLGAAVLAGTLGMGATSAQAAEFGIYVGGPAAHIPPCPGAGYFWTAGYMNHGYWVPGRWEFRGYRDRDRVAYFHRDHVEHFYRDRDDHRFDWDRDHYRR